jgi:hypothetical protein
VFPSYPASQQYIVSEKLFPEQSQPAPGKASVTRKSPAIRCNLIAFYNTVVPSEISKNWEKAYIYFDLRTYLNCRDSLLRLIRKGKCLELLPT